MPPHQYWRFAGFYLLYYAALGAYSPYVSRWLDGIGHGSYAIGILVGLMWATRVAGPLGWGLLNAHSPRPGRWLFAGSLMSALGFALLVPATGFFALFFALLVFGLFYNAVMPQFEAMTLHALGPRQAHYGRLRAWGSIGFILTVLVFGWALDRWGDARFPLLVLPLLVLMAAVAWTHRQAPAAPMVRGGPGLRGLLRQPGVRRFLLVASLMQLGFGAYYVFFTLYMLRSGHSGLVVGSLWAVGVLAEVVVFWYMPRLMQRLGAVRLFGLCLALTVVRWLLIALFPTQLAVLFPVQLLHAFSFGAFHSASMRMLAEFFPGRSLGAGQSVLYSLGSGAGGLVGALLAAAAWDVGGGRLTFLGAAGVTALAWFIHRRGRLARAAASGAARLS